MRILKWLFELSIFKNHKKEKYFRTIFFELIKCNKGSITVMEFAMQANVAGKEAKKYLDRYAIEFEATFESTNEGHLVYSFFIRNQNNKTDKAQAKFIHSNEYTMYQNKSSSHSNNKTKESHKSRKNSSNSRKENYKFNNTKKYTATSKANEKSNNFEQNIQKIAEELQKIDNLFKI